ncbi:F-box protein At2g26160-like [Vitis riparia]|uniref:F-box protein At2g26160-like n=1 Tax=Vitis riparia TaxID=96939 RepID=UPI00155A680F|nr:F-box protein At2g26160-like [Vitis riparia]
MALQRKFCPCFQTPWLLLPCGPVEEEEHDDEGELGISFSNLGEKKKQRDVCGEIYEGCCVGSSHGWLVLLDKTANLSVFNPFLGAQIQVGSLKEGLEFTDVDACTVKEDPRAFVPKAIVMFDYKKNKDGVVLIYGSRKKLAFCRYRDGRFMDLEGAHQPYHDIICYDDVVCALSDTGSVEVWDISGSFPTKIMDMEPPFPLKTANFGRSFRDLYSIHFYLVESCGELLFIVRFIGEFANGDGKPVREADLLGDEDIQPKIRPYKTLLFHVYRLDRYKIKWVEMESLGDQVVFLGGNHSMSLRVGDCPGCVKDTIYFTDSYWEGVDDDYSYGGHDMGYYNLRDRSVQRFYDTHRCKMKHTPFWVVSNPW